MKKIYGVNFHVKPKKKVHTYWFTDYRKARDFLESVKENPKVIDYSMYSIAADVFTKYKDGLEEPDFEVEESNKYIFQMI